MVEVVICGPDGTELEHLGRRFTDNAPDTLLFDDIPCEFVGFKRFGVALYRQRAVDVGEPQTRQVPPDGSSRN